VLTPQGKQKLNEARQTAEIQENNGDRYTLEELRDLTKLSIKTIAKVLGGQIPVDRLTLEFFFAAFGLVLERADYHQTSTDQAQSADSNLLPFPYLSLNINPRHGCSPVVISGRQPSCFASVYANHTVTLWEIETGRCLHTWDGFDDPVQEAVFSPTQPQLAIAAGREVVLWDTVGYQQICTFTEHHACIRRIQFSPDGLTLASGCRDGRIYLWDVVSQTCNRILQASAPIVSVCFSPAKPQLLSVDSNDIINHWDLSTGTCLRTFYPGMHSSSP
jgi:WD40 repeat protein